MTAHPQEPTEARASFRPDVEGLRAVAVGLVVLNHLVGWPGGGYLGVDVFFVISGFVITNLLWRTSRRGSPRFRDFYWRRARRLLPSALLVLLVTNLAVQALFLGPRVDASRQDSLWALGFLANVRMAATGTDYFHAADAPSVVQHYWSLAVEEQFYAVWPLLLVGLVVLARRRRSLVTTATGLLMLLSLGYAVWLVDAHPVAAYFSTPARAWELGVGAVAALVLAGRGRISHRSGEVLSWAGVVLLAWGVLVLTSASAVPGPAAIPPVLGTGLLVYGGSALRAPLVARVLSRRGPRYVGQISYPLYLWHWPVFTLAGDVWGTSTIVRFEALVTAVGLAVLTHHLVEEPLRGHRSPVEAYRALLPRVDTRRWAPVVQGAVATLVLVGAIAASASFRPPVLAPLADSRAAAAPSVVPAPAGSDPSVALAREVRAGLELRSWGTFQPLAGVPSEIGAPEWTKDRCLHVGPGSVDRCRYGPRSATRHAVLIGDSIAISWMPALRGALEPLGWDVQSLTLGQCSNALSPVIDGTYFGACDRHRAWAVDRVRRLRPDLVVLSNVARTDRLREVDLRGGTTASWERALARTLRAIVPRAGKVVVLGPPPGAGNPQTCMRRFGTPQDCTRPIPPEWDEVSEAEQRAAAETGARYVDSSPWFCWRRSCPVLVGGLPVYVDDRHLSPQFARYLVPVLRDGLGLARRQG